MTHVSLEREAKNIEALESTEEVDNFYNSLGKSGKNFMKHSDVVTVDEYISPWQPSAIILNNIESPFFPYLSLNQESCFETPGERNKGIRDSSKPVVCDSNLVSTVFVLCQGLRVL